MDYRTLLQDPEVEALRTRLHALRDDGTVFSDVIDADGHQYVDLVMEGGGTLGLALVGYIWALEKAGIRFLGIGGTSAGSIGGMLLAGLAEPQARKTPALLEALSSVDFIDFVDGGYSARKLANAISSGSTFGAVGWGPVPRHAAALRLGASLGHQPRRLFRAVAGTYAPGRRHQRSPGPGAAHAEPPAGAHPARRGRQARGWPATLEAGHHRRGYRYADQGRLSPHGRALLRHRAHPPGPLRPRLHGDSTVLPRSSPADPAP